MPYVNILTVHTPGNEASLDDIYDDLCNAESIWAQCGIDIYWKGRYRITDESLRCVDREATCNVSHPTVGAKMRSLFSRRFNAANNDIVVYYAAGTRLRSGATGCTSVDGQRVSIIIPGGHRIVRTLAHEIGHALGLEHVNDRAWPNNLMSESGLTTRLEPWQCRVANRSRFVRNYSQ